MEARALVAEIAVGLAGFSGVAVILGRGPRCWRDVRPGSEGVA